MTPSEAANHYLYLATIDVGAAIRFAHEYEDSASSADFDNYLHHLKIYAKGSGESHANAT